MCVWVCPTVSLTSSGHHHRTSASLTFIEWVILPIGLVHMVYHWWRKDMEQLTRENDFKRRNGEDVTTTCNFNFYYLFAIAVRSRTHCARLSSCC